MKKCKQGYYYCYTDEKCKPISKGLKVTARFSGGGREPEETGIDVPTNGNNQNGNGNGNGNSNGGSNGGGVSEGTLHKWFKGSKSKDGKGGWVNVVTGGTCASDEPGEGTPKCVSSAKRASMTKAQRLSAQRRKKEADPRQQQKSGAAKPTYVATDKKKMKTEETLHEDEYRRELARERRAERDAEKNYRSKGRKVPDKKKGPKLSTTKRSVAAGKHYADSQMGSIKLHDKLTKKNKNIVGLVAKEEVSEAKDKKGKGSGTKDACYHKVKSRYSVWPSAYASGALVKCRKVGAANWGNSTKKESYELSNWRDDFKATEYEFVDLIKPEPIKGGQEQIDEGQKCWKGYEKKGTKKMFGKIYNNCVKKEETEIEEKKDPCWDTHKQVGMKKKGGKMVPNCVPKEEKQIGGGNLKKLAGKATKRIDADTDGDVDTKDMSSSETGEFIPSPCGKKKLKPKVRFEQSDWRSDLGEDWQKVNKSDKTDGMSQKAVNAYRRENPGSKLKTAVTGNPKKGSKDAKRRSSYCSRSEGQKDMHNIDCTKTPDKAICKARRRWKC